MSLLTRHALISQSTSLSPTLSSICPMDSRSGFPPSQLSVCVRRGNIRFIHHIIYILSRIVRVHALDRFGIVYIAGRISKGVHFVVESRTVGSKILSTTVVSRFKGTLAEARRIDRWVFKSQYTWKVVVEEGGWEDTRQWGWIVFAGHKPEVIGYSRFHGIWTRVTNPTRTSRATMDAQNNSFLTRLSARH